MLTATGSSSCRHTSRSAPEGVSFACHAANQVYTPSYLRAQFVRSAIRLQELSTMRSKKQAERQCRSRLRALNVPVMLQPLMCFYDTCTLPNANKLLVCLKTLVRCRKRRPKPLARVPASATTDERLLRSRPHRTCNAEESTWKRRGESRMQRCLLPRQLRRANRSASGGGEERR